jgi:dolichyl-phosphate-mannose-protein mannosyltransferase
VTAGVVALLIASGGVLAASVVVATRLRPRGVLAFLLAIGLIAWASVEVIVGVAGLALRNLSPATLLTVALAYLALVLLWTRRHPASPPLRQRWRASGSVIREAVTWPPAAVATVLVAASLAWRVVLAVRLPVVDIAGWQYHLVTVDVWLQSNQIERVSQNAWTDGWPAGGELLTTWLAAFTRTHAFSGFTGLLPIPLGIVAVAGLARAFGADRRPALLAGLLFGMTPALVALAGTSYVDPATTAAVIAAWWLGLRLFRERDRATAVLFGTAAGLAIATKDTSLFLVLPILGGVLVAVGRESIAGDHPGARWRWLRSPAAQRLGLAFLAFMVFGGLWYVKDLLIHGNPIYPIGLGPLPGLPRDVFFENVPPKLEGLTWIEQVFRSWTADWHLTQYLYNVRPGGFGRAWLAIVPLAVAGTALLWRSRRWAALSLVVAAAVVGYVVLPSAWYARYTLFLPALALALAAVALGRLGARPASLAGYLLVGLAAISLAAANLAPNIAIPLPHGRLARATGYVAFVLTAPNSQRAKVDLARDCRPFDALPAGDTVAVTRAYSIPHAAVGQGLERILAQPVDDPTSDAELLASMEARAAQWLVTNRDDEANVIALADPSHFVAHGAVCNRGVLWQFVPG